MNQNLPIFALAFAVLVAGVLSYAKDPVSVNVSKGDVQVMERGGDAVGAVAGADFFERMTFYKNFVAGGTTFSTTSDVSAHTLTTTEIDFDDSLVKWTPNVDITVTTMASSAAPLNGLAVGESVEQLWYNASTSAAAAITFAAGTGVDLQEDEGGTVVVNGLEMARLTYIKKPSTDIALVVEPYQVGD